MREPRPDWSPLGVNFKILDEHPHLFYIRVPPSFPEKFTAEKPELNEYIKTLRETEGVACTCVRQLFAFPNTVLRKMKIHEH